MRLLVIFDREAQRSLAYREFSDDQRREAIDARMAAEDLYRNRSSVEVVVLGAETRADMERTHSRYFPLPAS